MGQSKTKNILILIVVFIAGITLCYLAYSTYNGEKSFSASAAQAQGTVTDLSGHATKLAI